MAETAIQIQPQPLPKGAWTGRHVVIALVAFFAVIFAINGLFLYFAITSFSGVETDNAYRRGVAYNAVLDEARREARLGWTATLSADGGVPRLVLKDAAGAPVTGAAIAGKVGRPSVDKFDRPVTFAEQAGGQYVMQGEALAAGRWIVALDARDGVASDRVFRLKERLWVSR